MKNLFAAFAVSIIFVLGGMVATIAGLIILADNGTAWPYLIFGPISLIGGMIFWVRVIFKKMPSGFVDDLTDLMDD